MVNVGVTLSIIQVPQLEPGIDCAVMVEDTSTHWVYYLVEGYEHLKDMCGVLDWVELSCYRYMVHQILAPLLMCSFDWPSYVVMGHLAGLESSLIQKIKTCLTVHVTL